MSLVDLGKRLLDAAKRGETEEVRTLMSNGAPFTTDWLGTSPLHFSAQFGHISTAEVLLRAGISRDARTKVDRTPLHVAAQEGHVEIVTLLIQHAADIDAKDMLKMTPLHWATEKGNLLVIERLLKAGADVSCENKFDRTPLDIAVINGRPDIVQAIQLAQHTAVGSLEEPTETITVETTEVESEGGILDGSETITIEGHPMDGHTMTGEVDEGTLLLQNMRHVKGEPVDECVEAEDGSSTSVLATLAALAEATAQTNTNNTSTTDAMNWLESQGITMISTSDGNIITSAVESGQTITLTEAGKIALNIIKQQGGLEAGDEGVQVLQDGEGVAVLEGEELTHVGEELTHAGEELHNQVTVLQEEGADKGTETITYVTEAGDMGTLDSDIHIQAVPHPEDNDLESEEPPMKRQKLSMDSLDVHVDVPVSHVAVDMATEVPVDMATEVPVDVAMEVPVGVPVEVPVESTEIDVDAMLQKDVGTAVTTVTEDEEVSDQEKLRRELEDIKRQAEEYKQQLKQKDKDLEEFKKQLGEINDRTDEPKT